MNKRGKGLALKIVFVIFVIVALATLYFSFYFTRKCNEESCFNDALRGCKKVNYLSNDKNVIWLYTIKGSPLFGEAKDTCKVEVEVAQAKSGIKEVEELVGKKMTCYVPLGLVVKPENDLEKCNGLLKEKIQTMIINKFHQYIVNNLGTIEEELIKVF